MEVVVWVGRVGPVVSQLLGDYLGPIEQLAIGWEEVSLELAEGIDESGDLGKAQAGDDEVGAGVEESDQVSRHLGRIGPRWILLPRLLETLPVQSQSIVANSGLDVTGSGYRASATSRRRPATTSPCCTSWDTGPAIRAR